MRTITAAKKRVRRKEKTNRVQQKKYKDESKYVSKNDEEIKIDNVRKTRSRKSRKASVDVQKVFISAIDLYDAPLKWWETEHVRYAINYPPVKSRLEKVMGSHVVRITDHKYMLLLKTKLLEDHMEQQKIRIKQRKLAPPSVMSRLLKTSYKILSETIHNFKRAKLKLFV